MSGCPFCSLLSLSLACLLLAVRHQPGLAHLLEHMAFKGTPRVGTTDYRCVAAAGGMRIHACATSMLMRDACHRCWRAGTRRRCWTLWTKCSTHSWRRAARGSEPACSSSLRRCRRRWATSGGSPLAVLNPDTRRTTFVCCFRCRPLHSASPTPMDRWCAVPVPGLNRTPG